LNSLFSEVDATIGQNHREQTGGLNNFGRIIPKERESQSFRMRERGYLLYLEGEISEKRYGILRGRECETG
jgi:hypothetical protein